MSKPCFQGMSVLVCDQEQAPFPLPAYPVISEVISDVLILSGQRMLLQSGTTSSSQENEAVGKER